MRFLNGYSREGTYDYKGIEFGVQVIQFSNFTEVKFTYEVTKETYWHVEGYTLPHYLDKLTWCKPVVWFIERKNNKLKEKLYLRALETIKKEGK